jgi:hypothetical protein
MVGALLVGAFQRNPASGQWEAILNVSWRRHVVFTESVRQGDAAAEERAAFSLGRLEGLFANLPPPTAQVRARVLLAESARFNIGPAIRTVNFPTLALTFLLPANQARFTWRGGSRRRIEGVETVEVEFEEVARPTLVDRGRDRRFTVTTDVEARVPGPEDDAQPTP